MIEALLTALAFVYLIRSLMLLLIIAIIGLVIFGVYKWLEKL